MHSSRMRTVHYSGPLPHTRPHTHGHPATHDPATYAPLPCLPSPHTLPCHAHPLPSIPLCDAGPPCHAFRPCHTTLPCKPPSRPEFLTHACENITLSQLRLRAAINCLSKKPGSDRTRFGSEWQLSRGRVFFKVNLPINNM